MNRFRKVIAENRKAYHDYHILDTFLAGIQLSGAEVKSVRAGGVSLKESFARPNKGEIWIYGMHISPYKQAAGQQPDPYRTRKLLLQRGEINRLIGRANEKGLTIVILKMLVWGNWIKVEIGLAKAKKLFDKRESLKKKALEMDMRKSIKANR